MLNFPLNAEPTITKGALFYILVSLSSLAPGFGWKLCMFININWTNVDQSNNTYNFLKCGGIELKLLRRSRIFILYSITFAQTEIIRNAEVQSCRDLTTGRTSSSEQTTWFIQTSLTYLFTHSSDCTYFYTYLLSLTCPVRWDNEYHSHACMINMKLEAAVNLA